MTDFIESSNEGSGHNLSNKTRAKISLARDAATVLRSFSMIAMADDVLRLCRAHSSMFETASRLHSDNVALRKENANSRDALLDFIAQIAATEWHEEEPDGSWCEPRAAKYVQEMEMFCNWAVNSAQKAMRELMGGA